jgi:hypothetical protein
MGTLHRLGWASIGFSLVLGGTALAQPKEYKTFYTQQVCGHPDLMFKESLDYGEDPLFGGETMIIGTDNNAYWGKTLFTVNQNNGFWTLFTFYDENTVCLTASGIGFSPF